MPDSSLSKKQEAAEWKATKDKAAKSKKAAVAAAKDASRPAKKAKTNQAEVGYPEEGDWEQQEEQHEPAKKAKTNQAEVGWDWDEEQQEEQHEEEKSNFESDGEIDMFSSLGSITFAISDGMKAALTALGPVGGKASPKALTPACGRASRKASQEEASQEEARTAAAAWSERKFNIVKAKDKSYIQETINGKKRLLVVITVAMSPKHSVLIDYLLQDVINFDLNKTGALDARMELLANYP